MRFPTVASWLAWQQAAHPVEIDPGLERVALAWQRLGVPWHAAVLTVGGTNGKGSVTAYLDSMLTAGGYETGLFTSPHLSRYNERIRVHGRESPDAALLDAFAAIDDARGNVSLTFFEWNALAAFLVFARAGVDVAVLEVGMGGRLDAVNLLDADVAAVVSIGLDHREWLGSTVEAIAAEKAGIFRPGRPAIFGGRHPPRSLVAHAAAIGARLKRIGTDFDFVERADGWDYVGFGSRRRELPLPALAGAAQLGNAAVALAILEAAEPRLLVPDEAVRTGLARVRLPGRFQVLGAGPEWILDVAHNPQAAEALAASLAARPCTGKTWAVCGILADKDVEGIVAALQDDVSRWIVVGLEGNRALPPGVLAERIRKAGARSVSAAADVAAGLALARAGMAPADRAVVFGSFLTVGPALEVLASRP
ncbi:MAG TPA: bifunctional tetrahydrofolate synthase/dihydrofolate synthase [Steroidobacteraceae bacterium]|nr:bifunctional tetrahydrofolate synthase/dihydrofolate synthase [Steroidobacteraceae bacterium]